MFASRAISSAHGGHRFTSSAKFKSTRQINRDETDRRRISEIEDAPNPMRTLACALVSSMFCPILGFIALFYASRAVRARNQGFYGEVTVFSKQAIRWSLITFIIGLTLGSIVVLLLFVKVVHF